MAIDRGGKPGQAGKGRAAGNGAGSGSRTSGNGAGSGGRTAGKETGSSSVQSRNGQKHSFKQREGYHPSAQPAKVAAARRARRDRMKEKATARKTGVTGEEVQRPHEPVLEVRPFSSVDFSAMVDLMPPEWNFPHMSPGERAAQAQLDIASSLTVCNVALVATVDDGTCFDPETVGFLLGRVPSLPEAPDAQTWQSSVEAGLATLEDGGAGAQKALTYEMQLADRGQMLDEAAGEAKGEDNELVLFVVGKDARGKGAGTALIEAWEGKLLQAGCKSYWLQTDTSCSWTYYENRGYTKVADIELGSEFTMPGRAVAKAGVHAGEGAPAAPHALMYRKDL